MLLLIQLSCDGFWAWPWPIILAFLLGAILGWLLKSLLGGDSNDNNGEYRQKYLDTKAELDLCKRDNKSTLAGAGALGASSLTANNAIASNDDDEYKQKYLALKADFDSYKKDTKSTLSDNKNVADSSTSNNDNGDVKYKQKYLDLKAEFDSCKKDLNSCKTDLDICRKEKDTAAKAGASSFAAKTVIDDSVKDDLTKVEGIGPKIKGLLNDDGIWSWKQLSEVSVERIQKVLDNAGPRYRVHNPASWPMQADMCHKGEWDKLDKWQDEHKGGRL